MDFSKVKRGYFVGIGGVGVNALARFATDFGIEVSGSDAKVNGLCAKLVERGAIIGDEPNFDAIDKADFLVFSSAIPSDNPEIARARKEGFPFLKGTNSWGKSHRCSEKWWGLPARTEKPRRVQCSRRYFLKTA